MDHAVFAGDEVHKRAERLDADDLAQENFADFDFTRERFDHPDGLLRCFAIGCGHKHATVVLDVHRRAGALDDATDGLATGADERADFVDGDLQGDDAWCRSRHFGTGRGDGGAHLIEDEQAAAAGLLERDFHDFVGDAGGFDVHLQTGDALGRTSDFEVHVAEVVFDALDVGQNAELAVLAGDQAHGHTRDRALDGHASVHQ